MRRLTWSLGRLIARTHAMFAITILFVITVVMASQVAMRTDFANSELYEDVLDRWGTPITQAVPSVRYVEHGSVFQSLDPLPLSSQRVTVDAAMNYRKRGLVYFSGFDFTFQGDYTVVNDRGYPIDIAFVFPLSGERNRSLLSDLRFSVDGQPETIELREGDDKLLWTGRVEAGQEVAFSISYRGRGLASFDYMLDPALPVRGLDFTLNVTGGDNFDYGYGVVPATSVETGDDSVSMRWQYDALESGVPVGAILPSEKGFDHLITTMTLRAWVPFGLFFAGLVSIGVINRYRFRTYETVLIVSVYSFFYVLLPYLASFTNFYLAYLLSLALSAGPVILYLGHSVGREAGRQVSGLLVASLVTPTAAVLFQGYTGLIYTLEIFTALIGLMVATTRPGFRTFLAGVMDLAAPAASPLTESHHGGVL